MSDGYTHDTLTIKLMWPFPILLGIAVFPVVGWQGSLIAVPLSYLGFNLQRVVSPDLDVDAGFYGFNILRKKNQIIGRIWELFWKPYALMVNHRSWVSHAPFVSTLIRFIYLFIPIWIIFWIIFQINLLFWWDWWLYLYFGMAIADLGHMFLDYLPRFRKYYERRYASNKEKRGFLASFQSYPYRMTRNDF